jgi:hypothetical protein
MSVLSPIRTLTGGPRVTETDESPEEAAKRVPLEKPIRVWTGGPGSLQETLVVPGTHHHLKPRADGSYLLRTPLEVEVAKKALGARFWTDAIPEDEESAKCDACQWTTRSYKAIQWHLNNAHGRPQFNG